MESFWELRDDVLPAQAGANGEEDHFDAGDANERAVAGATSEERGRRSAASEADAGTGKSIVSGGCCIDTGQNKREYISQRGEEFQAPSPARGNIM